jgi:hypothetical protein
MIKKEKTVHRESEEIKRKKKIKKRRSAFSNTHKKREERCPRLRVETFTREEEMRT